MAETKSKKWILAVLLAVLFPALAIHVSCVAVIGPGTWGSGVEEKVPQLLPATSNPAAAAYAREFAEQPTDIEEPAPGVGGIWQRGTVFGIDRLEDEGLATIATHRGETWIDDQHFFIWDRTAETTREIELPVGMIFERPRFLKRGPEAFIVFVRWNSWNQPAVAKLGRYLRSYADRSLLPEFSLYLYPLPEGPLTYWGPGHTVEPSPDRRRAMLLRSGALGAGYYSLHDWDFENDQIATVLSLREAEPGSGRSFDYRWSRDSQAVHITGHTAGFERRGGIPRALDLVYLVGEQAVYESR